MDLDDGLEVFDIVPQDDVEVITGPALDMEVLPAGDTSYVLTSDPEYREESTIYVNRFNYNDLGVSDLVFTGFIVCGVGLIVAIGVIVCLSFLRKG